MPSKSESQARLMAAAAHHPGGYGGVPQKVGREFNKADAGTKLLSRAAKDRPKAEKSGETKMARLTAKTRAKIPTSKFAGPGRSYPVQDKAHAKAAIGLAAMHNAPNKAAITAKAQRVLKGGGEKGGPPAGTTKAKGGMASRFDRMAKKSGETKY
jgi:hypothetical protein